MPIFFTRYLLSKILYFPAANNGAKLATDDRLAWLGDARRPDDEVYIQTTDDGYASGHMLSPCC